MIKNFLNNIKKIFFGAGQNCANDNDSANYGNLYKNKMTEGAKLTISAKLDKKIQKVQEEIWALAREHKDNLSNLLEIAKNEGARVYVLKNAEFLFKLIGEEEGFITPKGGICALFLNLFLDKNFCFKTSPLFIFKDEEISVYKILYAFYNWYIYKNSLMEFDENTIRRVKNIDKLEQTGEIDNLSYSEIMNLKHLIARNKEGMKFVLDFTKEVQGSKNAYNNLKDGSTNI